MSIEKTELLQRRFAVGSLYLRSKSAPQSEPTANPKGLFNGVGNAPALQLQLLQLLFTPNRRFGFTHIAVPQKKVFLTVATVA